MEGSMKNFFICFLVFGSLTAFGAERVACNISQSSVTKNESLILVSPLEISYPAGSLDFKSLNDVFTTQSLSIDLPIVSRIDLLVSARVDTAFATKKVRILEFKVHQKNKGSFSEISRTYYRLGHEELGIRHESIQFSFIVPKSKVVLSFECSKY